MIFSALVFAGYLLVIWKKFGVQSSISESYYDIPKKYQFVFTLVLWAAAIPIMIVGDTILLFIAGILICFVGAAPAFKGILMEYKVHMVGAYGGFTLGLLSLVIDYHFYGIVLMGLLGAVLIYWQTKNKLWWLEVLGYGIIWLSIFLWNFM